MVNDDDQNELNAYVVENNDQEDSLCPWTGEQLCPWDKTDCTSAVKTGDAVILLWDHTVAPPTERARDDELEFIPDERTNPDDRCGEGLEDELATYAYLLDNPRVGGVSYVDLSEYEEMQLADEDDRWLGRVPRCGEDGDDAEEVQLADEDDRWLGRVPRCGENGESTEEDDLYD